MTQLSDILLPSSIITTDNTKILTNKTISGADNTLTSLNASNISIGTVPTARLGSGTADATTYLRGDNTWQVVSASGGGEYTLETSGTANNVRGSTSVCLIEQAIGNYTIVSDTLNTYSDVVFKIYLETTSVTNTYYNLANFKTGNPSTGQTSTNVSWSSYTPNPASTGYNTYSYYRSNVTALFLYYFGSFNSRYIEIHCISCEPGVPFSQASAEHQSIATMSRGPYSSSVTVPPENSRANLARYNYPTNTAYGGITDFILQNTDINRYVNVYAEVWTKL
jgi:hypothetical protein